MKAKLNDLYKETWLRLRDSGQIVWTTREGKDIPIKDMSLNHLINTIKMIERKEALEEAYFEGLGGDWQG